MKPKEYIPPASDRLALIQADFINKKENPVIEIMGFLFSLSMVALFVLALYIKLNS